MYFNTEVLVNLLWCDMCMLKLLILVLYIIGATGLEIANPVQP